MKKQDALQGSLNLLVLKVLSRQPGLHGYAIMSQIRLLSGDVLRLEEGSLYPALHRMKEAGWLSAAWVTMDNGRRRREYRLTPAGQRRLGEEQRKWSEISAAVNQVLEGG